MHCEMLDIDDREPLARERSDQRGEGKVEEVLVIDRIEFETVDHIARRWHFDNGLAIVLEQ